MNTQPEALRLADELEAMFGKTDIDERVCKELRRLHEVNQMLVESAEMALEALEAKGDLWIALERKAKETLRQALAQHVDSVNTNQECVDETAKCVHDAIAFGSGFMLDGRRIDPKDIYTAPPKREWVGLTKEEKFKVLKEFFGNSKQMIDAVEAKLKEKNG